MKEFSPINQEQLTTQAHTSKLGIRGDIFMSGESGGETPPIHHSAAETGRAPGEATEPRAAIGHRQPVTPERQQEVREIWLRRREEQERGGEKVTREQIETEEKLIRMGIPPISGGSGDEPEDSQGQPAGQQQERGFGFYLQPEDMRVLNDGEEGPLRWLETQFDTIYKVAGEGQELSSPVVSNIQTVVSEAIRYLQYSRIENPEIITDFISAFSTRLNLIFIRSAIDHRSMDSAKEMSERLQAHGMLTALKMEDGNVNRMFSRMTELLEDKRLAQQQLVDELNKKGQTYKNIRAIDHFAKQNKLNPEAISKLEEKLIAGQLALAKKSKGDFGAVYNKEIGEGRTDEQAEKTVRSLIKGRISEIRSTQFALKQFHVTPEMMSRLQDDLIAEQLSLAERGVGQYEDVFNTARTAIQVREDEIRRIFEAQGRSPEQIEQEIKNLIKAEARKNAEPQIRRSVRAAYDVMVVSQRQGVIVARGHRLPGPVENYLSDPSGLFNVFNHEDLLTDKFNIYNKHAAEFLRELKLNMARSKLGDKKAQEMTDEELEDYGRRAFRDLFAVPDFFTSGWRIHGIQEAIKRRLTWENGRLSEDERLSDTDLDKKLKDFGLFLQLKSAGRDNDKRVEIWSRIAEIRPEEIVRLYRERAGGNIKLTDQMEKFFAGDAFKDFRIGENGERLDAFATYDKFKKEFGPLIQLLRQEGYKDFRALRLGQKNYGFSGAGAREKARELNAIFIKYFSGDDKKELVDIFGGDVGKMPYKIRRMFRAMSKVASGEDVGKQLVGNDKFEDIYTRTILVDDALLDRLEDPPRESGITPLSRFWTSEIGGDALVRNYKDTENAAKAAGNLLKFIYTEDPKERIKAAEDFADLDSQYNGQGGRAEALRYTVGSLLDMSKQDFIWDAIGISKLPFRKSMSRIEEIYGPQVHPMSRDELRVHVDNIHSMMVAAIDRTNKTPEEIIEDEKKAEATYHELEKLLEIDPKNMVKRRAASFLVYVLLAAVAESVFLAQKVAKEK